MIVLGSWSVGSLRSKTLGSRRSEWENSVSSWCHSTERCQGNLSEAVEYQNGTSHWTISSSLRQCRMDQRCLVRDSCSWLDCKGKSNGRNWARSSWAWSDRFDHRSSVLETHRSAWGTRWAESMRWRMGCGGGQWSIQEADLGERRRHRWPDSTEQQRCRQFERTESGTIPNPWAEIRWEMKGNREKGHPDHHLRWWWTKDGENMAGVLVSSDRAEGGTTYVLFLGCYLFLIILEYLLEATVLLNLVTFLFFSAKQIFRQTCDAFLRWSADVVGRLLQMHSSLYMYWVPNHKKVRLIYCCTISKAHNVFLNFVIHTARLLL